MKRVICLTITVVILFCGCASQSRLRFKDPVTFYYLEKNYSYGENGNAIAAEQRESYGQRRDLSYLMALYLMGPVEEDHKMPLPPGTRIYCSEKSDGTVRLDLSDAAGSLSDTEFSIAAACLALTCFDVSGCDRIEIANGTRILSLTENNLTLYDKHTEYPATEALP